MENTKGLHIISAIIPFYNSANTIVRAVNSLLNQTKVPDEILIIDDGSLPSEKKILTSFKDERIRVITVPENQGVCKARNKGIAESKGDLIVTLDADDAYKPSFIERALEKIDDKEMAAISCWCELYQGDTLIKKQKTVGGDLRDFLFRNAAISGALFKKEILEKVGGYDEAMMLGSEDRELWMAITRLGYRVGMVEDYLYKYYDIPHSRNKGALVKRLEIKKYLYKKYKKEMIAHYDLMIEYHTHDMQMLENRNHNSITSLDYRIGNMILKPLRWCKSLFK